MWEFSNPTVNNKGRRATIVRVKRYAPEMVQAILERLASDDDVPAAARPLPLRRQQAFDDGRGGAPVALHDAQVAHGEQGRLVLGRVVQML